MGNDRPNRRSTYVPRLIFAVLALLGLNATAGYWADTYARALLPLYGWSFEHLTPWFQIQSLRIGQEKGERVIKVRVQTTGSRQLGEQRIPNGTPVSSSTLEGHAIQPVIVMVMAVFLWPVRTWLERLVLIVLIVPALLMVESLDIPLVLVGALEDVVLFNMAPDQLPSSLLVMAMNFMNNGGRLALSLVATGLVIVTGRMLANRH